MDGKTDTPQLKAGSSRASVNFVGLPACALTALVAAGIVALWLELPGGLYPVINSVCLACSLDFLALRLLGKRDQCIELVTSVGVALLASSIVMAVAYH